MFYLFIPVFKRFFTVWANKTRPYELDFYPLLSSDCLLIFDVKKLATLLLKNKNRLNLVKTNIRLGRS